MKTYTVIVNDPPYGTEKAWNALRLARTLLTGEGAKVNLFLLGDSVSAAKQGQGVPPGYYNLEEMLSGLVKLNVPVKACGTCIKARGLKPEELLPGVEVGAMTQLAAWVKESDSVLTF